MKDRMNPNELIIEEKKAIKLFLWLFYIFYFSFDIFYFYIFPLYSKDEEYGLPKEGMGFWLYVFIFAILYPAIYFIKRGNPYIVKYVLIIVYIFIYTFNDILIYEKTTRTFSSGNIVEVIFILFSPIFVNKRFFWTVSSLVIGRYVFLGLLLKETQVLLPILIFLLIIAVIYIVLIRFYSYINALKVVHEDLRQKEKLAVIGQMAAAIGHEIRNPLASLKGFTQLQHERYPDTNEFYPIMIQEVDRINLIVDDLMYIGKPKMINFNRENIEEILEYTLSITQQQADNQGINIKINVEGPIPSIECDGKKLKQVLINLIKNAVEAMTDGGKIKIHVKVVQENKVKISIQDQGYGIKEEDLLNLGEPFYTTKKDGTGLGLMVTNQIIIDHNGELNIQSRLGEGTKVDVFLPINQNSVAKN